MLSQATLVSPESEVVPSMKVGDRVRVNTSVTLYTHPLHRNQPHDVQDMEGTVVKILHDWQGRPISPNFPVVVKFEIDGVKRPFKAHLSQTELDVI